MFHCKFNFSRRNTTEENRVEMTNANICANVEQNIMSLRRKHLLTLGLVIPSYTRKCFKMWWSKQANISLSAFE